MANYSEVKAIFNNPNVLEPTFNDTISTQNVLVWWLMGKPVNTGAGVKPTAKKFLRELDGGSRFEVPLMLQINNNLKSYAKDATFNLQANDVGDRAYFDIKSIGGPIPVYLYDIDVSGSSKTNLLKVTEEYISQAKRTLLNLVQASILGTAGAEGADDWTSILTLIPKDPTADSIGGISSATYSKWRNYSKSASGDSKATYLRPYITTAMINCSYGSMSPKLCLTTKTIYSDLHGQLVSNQRYVPDVELAKAGFKGLEYDGMSVMFDDTLSTNSDGSILLINPEGLELGALKGSMVKMDEFVKVPNADMLAGFVKIRGNMLVRDRRTNGHIHTFTTA